MRSRTRRPFSVEVKAAGRRQSTTIPSRITPPVDKGSRLFRDPLAEPAQPPVVSRRILPSLVVSEPQHEREREAAAEDRPRRRGRPRKAPTTVVEAVHVEPVAAEPSFACSIAPVPSSAPAKRTAKPGAALAPGERWKRRLGRWSR